MSQRIALLSLIMSIALVAPACGDVSSQTQTQSQRPAAERGAPLDGDFSGRGPGTLLEANALPTIDRRLRASTSTAGRVEYISTSGITNAETRVTGTVFAPDGPAPEGGWPVISLGHPTSGAEKDCAPSSSPSLLGLTPLVALLLSGGYVVTVTDYQGLGTEETYHPYLEPRTAGYNMIDAVRAARKLVPDASDRWLAAGFSQGGQAAWAANEFAAEYGKGLTLLGSASLAPPLDLTFVADAAASGTLTAEQRPAYISLLASLANEYPDFNLDDYRRGIVKQNWDTLLHCDLRNADVRAKLREQITADDLRPSSPAAIDTLRGYLQKMSLPQMAATAPMLVIFGDQDQFVSVESTDRALAAACSMGDVIEIQRQLGKGHADLDLATTVPWIKGRFDGALVTNSCAPPLPEALPEPLPEALPEGA